MSDSLFTSTPVGLDEPGMCSAQMCRMMTPAVMKGSMKWSEKKRLSAALSGAKPPRIHCCSGSPISGMAENSPVMTCAPQ